MKCLNLWVSLVAAAMIIAALTVDLDYVPPAWWDEGWTLSIARNWVELGHFGRLSLGERVPPGLQLGFPVTGLVALAFNYIGIGLFQARLVVVIYLVATLPLLFYLACRFYSRRVAVGALLVLLLMSGNRYTHPLFMGRQVLGEVPALFFLLGGYVCFLWAGERSRVFVLGSIMFWSLAIITKVQVLPFWALSLGVPIVVAVFRRQRALAILLAAALLGSVILAYSWLILIAQYLVLPSSPVSGLYLTIGLVLDPFRRFITALTTLQIGLPTLMGLVWALSNLKTGRDLRSHSGAVMLAFFVLVGSWFAWWELASTGWPRYLFPAAFLGSIFVAAMLHDWTDGFRVKKIAFNAATNLAHLKVQWRDFRVVAALFLVGWASLQTAKDLSTALIGRTNKPLFETVGYLNASTPSSAVIETYESELFFFLNRRYHYPPDQVHVELIRREDLGESRTIGYDPLSGDPDYLVVGYWCRYYKCYDAVLQRGAFELVQTFGSYQVFERVRTLPTL